MNNRLKKSNRGEGTYPMDIMDIIERLKKMRALNCTPSDVGITSYVLKGLQFNKLKVLTRFL